MRAICVVIVMVSGLSLSSFATPLEDHVTATCQRRDPQSLRDCYIKLLRTFKGHPRELARMEPRDAAVFCRRVADENESRFCRKFRAPATKPWITQLQVTVVAAPPAGDPWQPVLESASETTASVR